MSEPPIDSDDWADELRKAVPPSAGGYLSRAPFRGNGRFREMNSIDYWLAGIFIVGIVVAIAVLAAL